MSKNVIADTADAKFIAGLMERARKAQKVIEGYNQEQVDELVAAIVWEIIRDDEKIETMSRMALDETRLGDMESKRSKLTNKCRGLMYDLKKQKSVGIVEEIPEKGLLRMVKPLPLGCGKPKEITFQNPFRGKGDWLLCAGCGQFLRGENAESGRNDQIQQILAQLDVVQMV